MTSMLMKPSQNQSPLKRGIGLLLLIFIVYGTTVEAAHRHGRVVPPSTHGVAFEQTGSTTTSQTSQPGCSDCLICQLHQNFSATLISVKPDTQPVVSHTHTTPLNSVSLRSIACSPQSGRAPPQAN
ncbi:MAG TPA: hypothetical protein VFI24_20000 [Pyrinomonadaceae bacterium]|nr:hypothetical protein [Pyrinomonadaceae bacterium]